MSEGLRASSLRGDSDGDEGLKSRVLEVGGMRASVRGAAKARRTQDSDEGLKSWSEVFRLSGHPDPVRSHCDTPRWPTGPGLRTERRPVIGSDRRTCDPRQCGSRPGPGIWYYRQIKQRLPNQALASRYYISSCLGVSDPSQ
eukprot:745874-Hanusia_phi.AAC.3